MAAVGKTTLGAAVAPAVGLPFRDNELVMQQMRGVTIEELSRKPEYDAVIDGLLWETYQELAAQTTRTLIAASPRLHQLLAAGYAPDRAATALRREFPGAHQKPIQDAIAWAAAALGRASDHSHLP